MELCKQERREKDFVLLIPYVSSYYYICILLYYILHMCPDTSTYAYYYIGGEAGEARAVREGLRKLLRRMLTYAVVC